MPLLLFYGFLFLSSIFRLSESHYENAVGNIVFIILSQENSHHEKIAEQKKAIISKDNELNMTTVYIAPRDFPKLPGYWMVSPLLERLSILRNFSWAFFLEENTELNLSHLRDMLSAYDSEKELFIGRALRDGQPTIIHHFDPINEEPIRLSYPQFSAGFALSFVLLEKAALKWKQKKNQLSFSIDAKYELAKFLFKDVGGTRLIHDDRLCLVSRGKPCASWLKQRETPHCEASVTNGRVFFAVKTCEKYHKDRGEVVKSTWAPDADVIMFFSDVEDQSLPSVSLGIENVASGHCEKTLAIMKLVHSNGERGYFDWLVVVDDDTLISVPRVLKLLSCYDPSEKLALGERYGYSSASEHGYDYTTGGAGMVFSMPAVKEIALHCECPSVDSPDDMILGMCLKRFNIPIIHSTQFHQARPDDYALDFLRQNEPISFHKHWMVDPYEVYDKWLREKKRPRVNYEL